MSTEVSFDSEYARSAHPFENERVEEKVVQLNPERLSSIDYKTQVLFAAIGGAFGLDDFNAGNYLLGSVKLTFTLLTGLFLKGASVPPIALLSVINLSQGKYTDSKGKFIRQVVHLKKEEISSCNQRIALILCCFLGSSGAHQFYAGKPLKGVLMLCTIGGFGVVQAMNIYQLATCSFKDGQGKTICPDYIKQSAT